MRILLSMLALMLWNQAVASQNSHCTVNEFIYFNCKLKPSGKVASLCGTYPEANQGAYLQYRFGKIGKTAELLIPKVLAAANKKSPFIYDSGANRYDSLAEESVWFSNGSQFYALQHTFEPEEKDKKNNGTSVILLWIGHPSRSAKVFNCFNEDSGSNIYLAEGVIKNLHRPGDRWRMSPWDLPK